MSERGGSGGNRRAAWRNLRARQREQGIKPRRRATLPNGKARWRTVEEEAAARRQVVEEHHKVWRAALPVVLRRLAKIPDPRNPRSIEHRLTVVLLYGLLMFVLQMSSRREANREMSKPQLWEFATAVLTACAAALLSDGEPAHIATGLPLQYFGSLGRKFKESLEEADWAVEIPSVFEGRRRVRFSVVTLFPQAAGAFYSQVLDLWGEVRDPEFLRGGGLAGVVDVGYKTTDYLLVDLESFTVLEDGSGTLEMGMSDVYRTVQKRIEAEWGRPVDLVRVAEASLRGEMWFSGRKADVAAMVRDAEGALGDAVNDRIEAAWGPRKAFLRRVYLAGGGAGAVAQKIGDGTFPVETVPDPQFANARGFLSVAYWKDEKEAVPVR